MKGTLRRADGSEYVPRVIPAGDDHRDKRAAWFKLTPETAEELRTYLCDPQFVPSNGAVEEALRALDGALA